MDSVAAIAERYALTRSKVKVSLCRSRNRLREYLKKEGHVRGGEALLQLPCELEQRGAAFLAAPLPAAVHRRVAGDPGQEGEEVVPGLMGRDGIPGRQIHVVFARSPSTEAGTVSGNL